MDLLRNKKDIFIMANGKLVTKGLKENFCGDVIFLVMGLIQTFPNWRMK